MMPLIKYIVIGSISIVITILVSGYFFLDIALSDMCGNKLLAESLSPDKEYKAVMFQRDCGATSGFSTHISILDAIRELENESGNVLTADGHPDEKKFKMHWKSSNKLSVNNTKGAKIYKRERILDNMIIQYE